MYSCFKPSLTESNRQRRQWERADEAQEAIGEASYEHRTTGIALICGRPTIHLVDHVSPTGYLQQKSLQWAPAAICSQWWSTAGATQQRTSQGRKQRRRRRPNIIDPSRRLRIRKSERTALTHSVTSVGCWGCPFVGIALPLVLFSFRWAAWLIMLYGNKLA